MAERPKPTNMLARNDRQRGERNFGLTDTMPQPTPIVEIYVPFRSDSVPDYVLFMQTYHTPVASLQHWLAIETIIYARYEASRDENDDAQIIDLISPLIDLGV